MTDNKESYGTLFDETLEITFEQLCEVCAVETATLEEMIGEGILEPTRGSDRRFYYRSAHRVRTVIRLQRDLGVNLPGAALALELLDEINALKRQLRRR